MTVRLPPTGRLTRTATPRGTDKAPALPSNLAHSMEAACDAAPARPVPYRDLRLPRTASSA